MGDSLRGCHVSRDVTTIIITIIIITIIIIMIIVLMIIVLMIIVLIIIMGKGVSPPPLPPAFRTLSLYQYAF